TTMAFDHSRRRWFGTCSCKPVPRGLPSSVKQLRTSSAFRLFAVLTQLSVCRTSDLGEISLSALLRQRGYTSTWCSLPSAPLLKDLAIYRYLLAGELDRCPSVLSNLPVPGT